MRHSESSRQVNDACFSGRADEVGDDLNVILRRLLRMFLARPTTMAMGERGAFLANGIGSGRRHNNQANQKNRRLTIESSICSLCYIFKPDLRDV